MVTDENGSGTVFLYVIVCLKTLLLWIYVPHGLVLVLERDLH